MSNVVEHLERHLGPISYGWATEADGERLPFQVARFDLVPIQGVTAYSTVGFGRFPLHSTASGSRMRLELLMMVQADQADGPFPAILQDLAGELLSSGHAILRGDVIGPRGPLISGSDMQALYAARPVYLPDEFATAYEDGESVNIVWMVPITEDEAVFVADQGWSAFEDLLVERDPELTDFNRSSLVPPGEGRGHGEDRQWRPPRPEWGTM
ncbi:MAG: suppressor of fused domain protein [Actinobacteria bacterium]|nr:suppressor of fused domain protein [Actinomycetota bacterium]